MQNNTKNIIFDFGNVLIDLDIERTFVSLRHFVGDDYEQKLKTVYPNGDVFVDFEIGKISEQTFLETLRSIAETPLSIRQVKEAWNAMLLTIKPERFDMLLRLRQNHRVFLLSNTNETHYNFVDGYLKTVYGFDIQHFSDTYFDKAYYSHHIGLRKPNEDIYDYVLQDAQLKAEESLFIDDVAANTEGAKRVGMKVYQHRVGDEIIDIIESLL
ncbi:MAG: HAD family phosphatase [Saprospiraceae bacterium]|nr:HAD family phosphatase [Saprospiraceae bacterium]